MKLWHATTQKKAALYRKTGRICSPVRGFTTEEAAMAWAMKVLDNPELYDDPETALVKDCSQFYEQYYKESGRD